MEYLYVLQCISSEMSNLTYTHNMFINAKSSISSVCVLLVCRFCFVEFSIAMLSEDVYFVCVLIVLFWFEVSECHLARERAIEKKRRRSKCFFPQKIFRHQRKLSLWKITAAKQNQMFFCCLYRFLFSRFHVLWAFNFSKWKKKHNIKSGAFFL